MAKSKKHHAKNGLLGVFINLVLWVFSLSCVFPLVWMLYSSLKEKPSALLSVSVTFSSADAYTR